MGISDIVSALLGTRSYKEAYSKEKTLSILKEQAASGKINPDLVNILEINFDENPFGVECKMRAHSGNFLWPDRRI